MGYSKESVLPEQKVYCHTYDSLVGVLADRMVIREKVLLPQEGDSFDHEDIYSWISAVDLEDKGPKIEASLSAERGKNPITIDVEKQETIKSDDERVSNETLLYSMALTEAKMKVISDIAEETYPAIAFQIKDYRREMEKIREEILGNVEKGSSLDEILSRMSTRRGFLISTLVIAGMVLAACNHLSTPEPTATATPFQPQVTETSPAYETPGATETPFVEVTPTEEITKTPESGEYAELNMRIREFLNSEGAFTDEEIAKLNHVGFSREEVLQGNYLGVMKIVSWSGQNSIVDADDFSNYEMTQVFFQGIFLGNTMKENRILLYVGMIDKDGRRIVVPMRRTFYPEEGENIVNSLTVSEYESGSKSINSRTIFSWLYPDDSEKLAKNAGSSIIVDCVINTLSGSFLDLFNSSYGKRSGDKISEYDSSVPYCRKLLNSVPDVRGYGVAPLPDADEDLEFYTKDSFISAQEIESNSDLSIAYDMITFVRP